MHEIDNRNQADCPFFVQPYTQSPSSSISQNDGNISHPVIFQSGRYLTSTVKKLLTSIELFRHMAVLLTFQLDWLPLMCLDYNPFVAAARRGLIPMLAAIMRYRERIDLSSAVMST